MSAPPKTSVDEILFATHELIEANRGEFTMADVAQAVGIRAPSLHKRYTTKSALTEALGEQFVDAIRDLADAAIEPGHPKRSLRAFGIAWRKLALEHPRTYLAIFPTAARRKAFAALAKTTALVIGGRDAVAKANAFFGFVHGAIALEIMDEEPRDEAFPVALDAIIDSLC